MIPHKADNEVHMAGVDEGSTFKMVMNAHMASLLSDKMYKDKPAAVIRELSCNAQDSHVDANQKKPIYIHLPTMLEPWFSVEDWGVGLDDTEVHELFTTYGASSKRESNKVVGQFGIGSKVGFAYTDQFTVVATKDGVRRNYSCYKDEELMPRVTLIGAPIEDSSLENGVKIQVPVKPNDVDTFVRRAGQQLSLFRPLPDTNMDIEFSYLDGDELQSGDSWVIYKHEHVRHGQNRAISVAMGSISYPVDLDQLNGEAYSWMGSCQMLLNVDIGVVDVSASREELSYNEATIKALTSLLLKVQKESAEALKEEFKDCNTEWERRVLYTELVKNHPLATLIRNHYKQYADFTIDKVWGQKHDILTPFCNVNSWDLDSTKGNVYYNYHELITCNTDMSFLVHIENNTTELTSRLRAWYHKTNQPAMHGSTHYRGRGVYTLIKVPSEAHLKKLKKKMGSPPESMFHNMWEITEQDIEDWATAKGMNFNKKNTKVSVPRRRPAKFMKFNPGHHRGYSYAKVEDKREWTKQGITVDLEAEKTGVYVQLKDYRISHPHLDKFAFSQVVEVWKNLGLVDSKDNIIGIFAHFRNPFEDEPGWVDLTDRWEEWLARNLSGGARTRRQLKDAALPDTGALFRQPDNNVVHPLTSILNDGIISIEASEDYRRWYHSLMYQQNKLSDEWIKLVKEDTRFRHIIAKTKYAAPPDSYYNNRYIPDETKPSRQKRMKNYHQKIYGEWSRSYPLLPSVLKYEGTNHKDHVQLYMEKVNES